MLEAHYMLTHLHPELIVKWACKLDVMMVVSCVSMQIGGMFYFLFRYDLFKFIQLDLKL